MARCGCGTRSTSTVWLLEYENGAHAPTEHATKIDAEIADTRNGGGGIIRPVSK
jgi:hypothetical protein